MTEIKITPPLNGLNLSKLEILSATILANTNSITVNHTLGASPTFAAPIPTNDNASQGATITNRTSTTFDITFAFGLTQPGDSTFICLVGV